MILTIAGLLEFSVLIPSPQEITAESPELKKKEIVLKPAGTNMTTNINQIAVDKWH
jgi:hypothetical protein